MASKSFGEFKSKGRHGWYTARLQVLLNDLDRAFLNSEGGLKRTTVPFFCCGDGGFEDNAIEVDPLAAHQVFLGAYHINYGLGYWTLTRTGGTWLLYALEGHTARDYTIEAVANTSAAWALVWDSAASKLTIKIPNDNSGTLLGLRAALMAAPTIRSKFAVQGEDAFAVLATHVKAETAITEPAAWGTGITAMAMLQELAFYRMETNYAILYLDADVFGTSLDDFIPVTLQIEVWSDGQLMTFQHICKQAGVE